ncbi:MAG: FMN-binding glutamate synthase family protein [Candidatus Auribacterota bacterium]|jgi:glutamate synthase domain-containing protein 2|uniref:FMN-binding glutamate synthase family protein n=1 Tax=Candidatus Auribacter fodinae TaxID=2093366 RepID=A0A3A4R3I1_9BACT|nr:MAG: FMN-binding glutamate synthase family protein [Candidatus Auribacter fodinae]
MNLSGPKGNDATRTANRSKDVVLMSGLCARCIDGCRGNCEVFKASFRGRELIYPGPFGDVTAGAKKDYPVDYSHLNIHGYAFGAKGLPAGVQGNPDTAIFPAVNTETSYGWDKKVTMSLPIFTGALGSTEIARKNWEHFAVGAALSGVTIVCGENVCGIDPKLVLKNGKVVEAPDMDRRIEAYKRYHQGKGEILIQMNVEDTRLGVAEYIINKHGIDTIELKWGQGAKCIGGEIKVKSLERALELQKRGYIVTPDPSDPINQQAFKDGALEEFERHSRLGFIDEDGFYKECARLRKLGYKRITLKTGAYGLRELAMALKWSSKAQIDLLTIDGAPGGTGMSPWRMMEEWGMPTIYLHAAAYEFATILQKKGLRVPDLAFAGGFSSEDGIYKALALGAPYTKAICMGRALMIPGMVGKNIDEWLKNNDLPNTVSQFGKTPEEIFVCYENVVDIVGKSEIKKIPLGAIGIYCYSDKLKVGLQQLMAGSRCFSLPAITRNELMSLTEECAKVTGIPYLMDSYRAEAMSVLNN